MIGIHGSSCVHSGAHGPEGPWAHTRARGQLGVEKHVGHQTRICCIMHSLEHIYIYILRIYIYIERETSLETFTNRYYKLLREGILFSRDGLGLPKAILQ